MGDISSRKWLLTINNPKDLNLTHEQIKQILPMFPTLLYWCMADEQGSQYHTHLYIYSKNPIRFSTLQSRFKGAHIDKCKGTSLDNRTYIRKEGKYENTDKAETRIEGTFEEMGECPVEMQGQRNDLDALYDMIKNGLSNAEIFAQYPQFMLNTDKIDRARQVIVEDIYKKRFRTLDVTYIFGHAGKGKTRYVMEKYGYDKVYRVTDYYHPFDTYSGQDVVIFEEFRSSLKIQDMLNYLDGYPLMLPARFSNRVACYTKVYLISNIPLEEQYKTIQLEQPETWKALIRRIHHGMMFDTCGIKKFDINAETDFRPCTASDDNPFLRVKDKYTQQKLRW